MPGSDSPMLNDYEADLPAAASHSQRALKSGRGWDWSSVWKERRICRDAQRPRLIAASLFCWGGAHIQRSSGITSWLCAKILILTGSGDHSGGGGSNPKLACVRPMPSPLCYRSLSLPPPKHSLRTTAAVPRRKWFTWAGGSNQAPPVEHGDFRERTLLSSCQHAHSI